MTALELLTRLRGLGVTLTPWVDRLERALRQSKRENGWWKIIGSCATVALVTVLLLGAAEQETAWRREIRAGEFVAVDEAGRKRVDFTRYGLTFFDEKGEMLLW